MPQPDAPRADAQPPKRRPNRDSQRRQAELDEQQRRQTLAESRALRLLPTAPRDDVMRCDVHGPLPYDPEVTRDYDLVPADLPLDALYRVQLDGLGPKAVRIVDGRSVFADPAGRAWAAGAWRIVFALGNVATEGHQPVHLGIVRNEGDHVPASIVPADDIAPLQDLS